MLRVSVADAFENFHPDAKRLETFSIDHMNLRAAAEFIGKFVKGWLEIIFAKKDARQV